MPVRWLRPRIRSVTSLKLHLKTQQVVSIISNSSRTKARCMNTVKHTWARILPLFQYLRLFRMITNESLTCSSSSKTWVHVMLPVCQHYVLHLHRSQQWEAVRTRMIRTLLVSHPTTTVTNECCTIASTRHHSSRHHNSRYHKAHSIRYQQLRSIPHLQVIDLPEQG